MNISAYLASTRARESGGNDAAKNPNSSASGRYQFIDSTFLSYARRLYPGLSDAQLMAMKNDPAVQDRIMSEFTSDNSNTLRSAGFDVNDRNLYLSHFLGPQGAVRVLRADPKSPITTAVDGSAISANPFLNGMTVGDLLTWAETKKRPDANTIAMNNATGLQSEAEQAATFGKKVAEENPMAALFGLPDEMTADQASAIRGFGIGGLL